eukprot:PhM_4_TR13917/c1_g2_i1/m.39935
MVSASSMARKLWSFLTTFPHQEQGEAVHHAREGDDHNIITRQNKNNNNNLNASQQLQQPRQQQQQRSQRHSSPTTATTTATLSTALPRPPSFSSAASSSFHNNNNNNSINTPPSGGGLERIGSGSTVKSCVSVSSEKQHQQPRPSSSHPNVLIPTSPLSPAMPPVKRKKGNTTTATSSSATAPTAIVRSYPNFKNAASSNNNNNSSSNMNTNMNTNNNNNDNILDGNRRYHAFTHKARRAAIALGVLLSPFTFVTLIMSAARSTPNNNDDHDTHVILIRAAPGILSCSIAWGIFLYMKFLHRAAVSGAVPDRIISLWLCGTWAYFFLQSLLNGNLDYHIMALTTLCAGALLRAPVTPFILIHITLCVINSINLIGSRALPHLSGSTSNNNNNSCADATVQDHYGSSFPTIALPGSYVDTEYSSVGSFLGVLGFTEAWSLVSTLFVLWMVRAQTREADRVVAQWSMEYTAVLSVAERLVRYDTDGARNDLSMTLSCAVAECTAENSAILISLGRIVDNMEVYRSFLPSYLTAELADAASGRPGSSASRQLEANHSDDELFSFNNGNIGRSLHRTLSDFTDKVDPSPPTCTPIGNVAAILLSSTQDTTGDVTPPNCVADTPLDSPHGGHPMSDTLSTVEVVSDPSTPRDRNAFSASSPTAAPPITAAIPAAAPGVVTRHGTIGVLNLWSTFFGTHADGVSAASLSQAVDRMHEAVDGTRGMVHGMFGDNAYVTWNSARRSVQHECNAANFFHACGRLGVSHSYGAVGAFVSTRMGFSFSGSKTVLPYVRSHDVGFLMVLHHRYAVPLRITVCDYPTTRQIDHLYRSMAVDAVLDDAGPRLSVSADGNSSTVTPVSPDLPAESFQQQQQQQQQRAPQQKQTLPRPVRRLFQVMSARRSRSSINAANMPGATSSQRSTGGTVPGARPGTPAEEWMYIMDQDSKTDEDDACDTVNEAMLLITEDGDISVALAMLRSVMEARKTVAATSPALKLLIQRLTLNGIRHNGVHMTTVSSSSSSSGVAAQQCCCCPQQHGHYVFRTYESIIPKRCQQYLQQQQQQQQQQSISQQVRREQGRSSSGGTTTQSCHRDSMEDDHQHHHPHQHDEPLMLMTPPSLNASSLPTPRSVRAVPLEDEDNDDCDCDDDDGHQEDEDEENVFDDNDGVVAQHDDLPEQSQTGCLVVPF